MKIHNLAETIKGTRVKTHIKLQNLNDFAAQTTELAQDLYFVMIDTSLKCGISYSTKNVFNPF